MKRFNKLKESALSFSNKIFPAALGLFSLVATNTFAAERIERLANEQVIVNYLDLLPSSTANTENEQFFNNSVAFLQELMEFMKCEHNGCKTPGREFEWKSDVENSVLENGTIDWSSKITGKFPVQMSSSFVANQAQLDDCVVTGVVNAKFIKKGLASYIDRTTVKTKEPIRINCNGTEGLVSFDLDFMGRYFFTSSIDTYCTSASCEGTTVRYLVRRVNTTPEYDFVVKVLDTTLE